MIQDSMRLSDWLSRFMTRVNSRNQETSSNRLRTSKQEMVTPVKHFSGQAAIVTLGGEPTDKKTEIVTYDNKAAYHKKNNVAQDKKEPPTSSIEPSVMSQTEKSVFRKTRPNTLEQSTVEKIPPKTVAEKILPTELPDFKGVQQSQFKEFQSAWGAKAGSDNFNESYDFDGNGAIDMVDYLQFGKEFNSAFEGFKQSWGTRSEDAEFASQFDYDSNGVIDMVDYLNFGKNWLA